MAGTGSATADLKKNLTPEQQALLGQAQQANSPFGSNAGLTLYTGSKMNMGESAIWPKDPITWGNAERPQTVNVNYVPTDGKPPRVIQVTLTRALPDGAYITIEKANDGQYWWNVKDKHNQTLQRMILRDPNVLNALNDKPFDYPGQGAGYDVATTLDHKDFYKGYGKQTETTDTIDHQLQTVYQMKPDDLMKIKKQLWLAGMYPNGTTLKQVTASQIINGDDATALMNVMVQAARYHQAGQPVTWQDLLQQMAASGGDGPAGSKQMATLTDPADIADQADTIAQQILGRAASPDDVRLLVQLVHGRENHYAQLANQGADSAEATSPGAEIKQFFRQKYPNEAMAMDWGARAATWEQMLQSSAVKPPVVNLG